MNEPTDMPALLPLHGSELSAYVVGKGSKECLVVGGIGSHPLDFAPVAEQTDRTFFVVQNPFHEGIKRWDSCEPPSAVVSGAELNTKKRRRERPMGWRTWWHEQLEKAFNGKPWEEFIGHSSASEPMLERKHPESLCRITLIGSPTVQSLKMICSAPWPHVGETTDPDVNLIQTTLSGLCAGMEQKVFDDLLERHIDFYGNRLKDIMHHEDPKKALPSLERARTMVLGVKRNIQIIFIKDEQFDPWHDEARFQKIIDGIPNVLGVNCRAGHYGHVGDTKTLSAVINQPYAKVELSL